MVFLALRRLAALSAATLLTISSHVRADTPRLEQMATSGLADIQATVTVVQADQNELERINHDFGMAYRLKKVLMRYKEPNKLRMDGKIGSLIINGSTRFFRVPPIGLKRKDDLGTAPGKRHTLLDVGLITRSALADMQSRYVRDDTLDGANMRVFEVTYRGDDTQHYVLWINARTHVVEKREWYNGADRLRATFLYLNSREVRPGVWIPTRLEIRNGDGEVAGITAYTDLKVNQGLDDALFTIS